MKIEKKQEYYLTKFTMINNKFDVAGYVIDKIGAKRYIYFKKLYETMDNTNRIDFKKLNIKEDSIKRLRSILHKYGFIRKCKIDDSIGFDWYLNPYIANKDNKKNKKLSDIFLSNENLPKQVSSEEVKNLINILF